MSAAALATLPLRPLATRLGRRFLLAGIVVIALGAGYQLWLRDAAIFAVKTVRIEGVAAGSPDAERLRRALTEAGREMTTLHLRPELLTEAVAGFPLVRDVTATADFPSALTVRVARHHPVALIGSGPDATAVAEDGSLLTGLAVEGLELPALPLQGPPQREQLRGAMLDLALVLGAAPPALLEHAEAIAEADGGVAVRMRSGIELRFGDPSRARAKWLAAAAVLADPALTALDYVDLTSARRAAVGGSGSYLPPAP